MQVDLSRSLRRRRRGQHNLGRTLQLGKIAMDVDFLEQVTPALSIQKCDLVVLLRTVILFSWCFIPVGTLMEFRFPERVFKSL